MYGHEKLSRLCDAFVLFNLGGFVPRNPLLRLYFNFQSFIKHKWVSFNSRAKFAIDISTNFLRSIMKEELREDGTWKAERRRTCKLKKFCVHVI